MLVLEASDPDGEELTFDVPSIPPGASFNSSESTLYFFWNVTSADEVLCVCVYLSFVKMSIMPRVLTYFLVFLNFPSIYYTLCPKKFNVNQNIENKNIIIVHKDFFKVNYMDILLLTL